MGRQQLRLLLCSIAALALLITALFGMTWFSASLGFGPAIELDLRHARMCQDGICTSVPMGKMQGFFPIAAGIAFWTSLPVILLLVLQTGARVLTGVANDLFTKIGYFLAGTAFMFGFVAGFLFGPESQSLGEMAVVTVERTSAPALFVIGSLLSMIALRLSTAEWLTNDDAGEYKPVVVRKDSHACLPVTPLTGVKTVTPAPMAQRTPTPSTPRSRPTTSPPAGRAALPDSLPFDNSFTAPPDLDRELPSVDTPRSKTPTGKPLEVSLRARPPSEPPIGHEPVRSKSPTGPGPIENVRTASKAPLSEDDLVGVDQRARTIDLEPQRARTSSSGPVDVAARLSAAAAEAAASLSVKPPLPVAEPTPPDEIAVAPESGLRIRKRAPTGGNQPPTRDEPSPSMALPEVGLHFKKPSAPGSEPEGLTPPHDAESPLQRKKSASTMPTISADGLADGLAEALAQSVATASTKPQTVPPPVSGTKTQTLPPPVGAKPQTLPPAIAAQTLPPPVAAPRTQTLQPPVVGTKPQTMPPPVVETKSQTQPPPIAAPRTQTLQPPAVAAKPQTLPPPIAAAKTQTLPPPIAARPFERQKTQPPPEATVRPATASGSGSMPAQSDSQGSAATIAEAAQAAAASMPAAAPSSSSSAADPSPRASSTYSQRFPRTTKPPENKAVEPPPADPTPEALRGKIKYAVVIAELVGAGINARRDDGVSKLVEWGDIVGIVARRFPPGAPYDGATFVDLVSTTGATLRILPWTQIKGLELKGSPAARARGLVNIVAAQSLDAKLDTATKLFADSEGQATQLPDATALAAHDQRLA